MSGVIGINEMWHKDLPEPLDLDAFAEYVEPKGWKVYREWLDELEDSETGEVYEAGWFYFMQREKRGNDGRIYMWNMSLSEHSTPHRDFWDLIIEVADGGWKHFCEERGIAP